MDSPQSVVSPFKPSPSLMAEPENEKTSSGGCGSNGDSAVGHDLEEFMGTLKIYVHQARDIHNICIYHKQDVYAKLCLTSDPDQTVSTKIINGGGRSPVFDEDLQLKVRVLDTSLKCEIFMMSRVKNYLEDQLLGFALIPLSEVVFNKDKLEREFSLSSTDLFHSPAGYVQLSLSYNGAYPEVMTIPVSKNHKDPESIPDELDKIEFPDPNVVNENEQMVSEYFGISCSSIDSETSDSFVTMDAENGKSVEKDVTIVESFDSINGDSHETINPTNGASSPRASANSITSDAAAGLEAPNQEQVKDEKKYMEAESEPKVVQQEIVDMYMKSMQQFTESLAKMKLPLDIDSPTKSENSSSDHNLQTPKSTGSRVFYGSRPFF